MYQLGLSQATAEVPSMSAVALGANRWASRVVVVLQLAAWSAVGIVLLQKGVSSLQKTPVDVRNATKSNQTDTLAANLIMKKITVSGEPDDLFPQDILQDREYPNTEESKASGKIKLGEESIDGKIIPGVIPIPSLTPNHLSPMDKKPALHANPENGEINSKRRFHADEGLGEENSEATTTTFTEIPNKFDKILEVRKKTRITNLSGGGAAAAAVAMVVVGAVMLILGPVVIILRALDERRQERRFLKLSGQDDLPPSYEQATLMDEAPRYSTLSLNTINCSNSASASAVVTPENSSPTNYHSEVQVSRGSCEV